MLFPCPRIVETEFARRSNDLFITIGWCCWTGTLVSHTRPAPMAHSYRLGIVTWRYQVRIPVGPDICHRGCVYTVLQTVQKPGVYSAAYGTVLYKEPLKSFEIRVGHSPGFGLLVMRYCHDRAESDVRQYLYSYSHTKLTRGGVTFIAIINNVFIACGSLVEWQTVSLFYAKVYLNWEFIK